MRKPSCLLLLGWGIFAGIASAQTDAPNPVLAESLRWMSATFAGPIGGHCEVLN